MLGIWTQAIVGLLVGSLFGLMLFPWLASPFGPSLWKLSTPFTRIFLTVSQFIRGNGVLVKTRDGTYEIGTYIPEEQETGPAVQLSNRTVEIDPDRIQWGLFGKKPFGLTWEPGTPLHTRVSDGQTQDVTATDGGFSPLNINMAAVHRYLRGANESDAIDRTEEHAKAEFGGGDTGFSDKLMAGMIMLMLILGSLTSYLAF